MPSNASSHNKGASNPNPNNFLAPCEKVGDLIKHINAFAERVQNITPSGFWEISVTDLVLLLLFIIGSTGSLAYHYRKKWLISKKSKENEETDEEENLFRLTTMQPGPCEQPQSCANSRRVSFCESPAYKKRKIFNKKICSINVKLNLKL